MAILNYATIQDFRNEGVPVTVVDATIQLLIRDYSARISLLTGQQFQPERVRQVRSGGGVPILTTRNSDHIQEIRSVEIIDPLGQGNSVVDPVAYSLVNDRMIIRYKLGDLDNGQTFDGVTAEDVIDVLVAGFGKRKVWPDGNANLLIDVVLGWQDPRKTKVESKTVGLTSLPVGSTTFTLVNAGDIQVGDSLLVGDSVHVIVKTIAGNVVTFDPTFDAVPAAEFASGNQPYVRRYGQVPYLIKRALVLWAVRAGLPSTPGGGGSGSLASYLVEERTDNYQYKLNRSSAGGTNPANDPTSTGYADIDQLLAGFSQPPFAGWV